MASCALLQGEPSHAWGGLHAHNYKAPQDIVAGGIDPPGSEPNQHFIYEFELLRVAAADIRHGEAAESSGLILTLDFPLPVVITAVYGGYAAADVTDKEPNTYRSRGSKTVVIQLCADARYHGDACPRELKAAGLSSFTFEKLELQGERRAPLEEDETQTSIMAVSAQCESDAQRNARLARQATPASPPPPAPRPPVPSPQPRAYSYEDLTEPDWAVDARVVRSSSGGGAGAGHGSSGGGGSALLQHSDDYTIAVRHSPDELPASLTQAAVTQEAVGFGARPLSPGDDEEELLVWAPSPPMMGLGELLGWGDGEGLRFDPPPPPILPFTSKREAFNELLVRAVATSVLYVLLGGCMLLVLGRHLLPTLLSWQRRSVARAGADEEAPLDQSDEGGGCGSSGGKSKKRTNPAVDSSGGRQHGSRSHRGYGELSTETLD